MATSTPATPRTPTKPEAKPPRKKARKADARPAKRAPRGEPPTRPGGEDLDRPGATTDVDRTDGYRGERSRSVFRGDEVPETREPAEHPGGPRTEEVHPGKIESSEVR